MDQKTRIIRPEQIILRFNRLYTDVGAFCYLSRSRARRKPGQPLSVDKSSYSAKRVGQIGKTIKRLSIMLKDGVFSQSSVHGMVRRFKQFMDWADDNAYHDCLDGGEATEIAFRLWAEHVYEQFRHHKLTSGSAGSLQSEVCELLEQITNFENLRRGVRFVSSRNRGEGSEPASEYDFAQTLALNQSLFDGLCDLVLENLPFPFKLKMPGSIGWKNNHLWLFPSHRWHLAPHLWGGPREKLAYPYWAYDYENGRIASVEEIAHHYSNKKPRNRGREHAKNAIKAALAHVDRANTDARHRVRVDLAMVAQSAFLFLFHANTGCNSAVARDIETDGSVDASTLNQSYRVIKMRTQGKEISVVCPASFMPSLRRFMELRKYLLNGVSCPFLFFTLGMRNKSIQSKPEKIYTSVLHIHHENIRRISPAIPRISPIKIRATVNDYYRRTHDGYISSRVMGHSEAVADRSYLAGSPVDHHDEFTLFLDAVSNSARKQKVVSPGATPKDVRSLEEGGKCTSYGKPEAIEDAPSIPDCNQGCLFCVNRVLVANEEDARKVASAAFVMEQLISGPLSESEFRLKILKCDQDLEKMASFNGCESMVLAVKRDVYEKGNLTPYFADKFQLFLELGIL
nr:hypothetical protein [uncultured Massilia sp.]